MVFTPFCKSIYDIIHLVHFFPQFMPININSEEVSGHHKPKKMETKHKINHIAASSLLSTPPPTLAPKCLPLLRSLIFYVQLKYGSSIITSKAYNTSPSEMHDKHSVEFIKWKTGWDTNLFSFVD
jgi:hypothetical protein